MNDLLADELQAVKRQQVKTVTLFAFCVASAAIGLTAAPLAPLALGAAFLPVGQFGAERFFGAREPGCSVARRPLLRRTEAPGLDVVIESGSGELNGTYPPLPAPLNKAVDV